MFKKLFFLVLVFPLYISAMIVKTDSIQDICKYTQNETLILLNIDTAVIESSLFLGSAPWYDFLKIKIEELSKKYPKMDSTFYYKLLLYITQKVPVGGFEPITSSFIEQLQAEHFPVLAFTGRGKNNLHGFKIENYDKQTINELNQAHIDFSKSEIPDSLQNLPEPYTIVKGIIFADEQKKGPFLKAILEKANYFPKRIIFVSKQEHLVSVEASMRELGIDFVGIRYDYIEQNSYKFDLLAALIQLKSILETERLVSNKEAIALKPQYENLSIDVFTESLLFKFLNTY
jgi:Protein of unknown function (DUF2608)